MRFKNLLNMFLVILISGCSSIKQVEVTKNINNVKYSGLRSSSYGVEPFPHQAGWKHAFDRIQSYFPGSQSCGIWIISNIDLKNNECILEFPRNEGDTKEYEHVVFTDEDKHEKYLTYFDENNIKVFLQVESGKADMKELIDLVLKRYGHHPSVIGFGVDLEWYSPYRSKGMNGETFFSPLKTQAAEEWDRQIKSYNPEYRLFLKHWLYTFNIMPQSTQSDIIFINDAQDFSNLTGGDAKKAMLLMADNFGEWAAHFRRDGYVRSVGYQIGYDSDRNFWQELLKAPYPKSFAELILERIPQEQEVSIFWVDFTMNDVFMHDYSGPVPVVELNIPGLGENYTIGAKVRASSREGGDVFYDGEMAADNNLATRWASIESDTEWIEIELTEERTVKTIALFWEDAFAEKYIVESSLNGRKWNQVYYEDKSDGEEDYISLDINAKYIRIKSVKRSTEWGISLYEVGIYGNEYKM